MVAVRMTTKMASITFLILESRIFILHFVILTLTHTKRAPKIPQIIPEIITNGKCYILNGSPSSDRPNLMRPVLASPTYYPSFKLMNIFNTKVASELAQKVLSSKVKDQ